MADRSQKRRFSENCLKLEHLDGQTVQMRHEELKMNTNHNHMGDHSNHNHGDGGHHNHSGQFDYTPGMTHDFAAHADYMLGKDIG